MSALHAFRYSLEPLRHVREGELEVARLELARAQRSLRDARARLDSLEVRFAAARLEASRRAEDASSFNLHGQRIAGAWFASLRSQMQAAQARVQDAQALHEAMLTRVRELHAALEALERHRRDARDEHARNMQHTAAVMADDAWLQRPQPDKEIA